MPKIGFSVYEDVFYIELIYIGMKITYKNIKHNI